MKVDGKQGRAGSRAMTAGPKPLWNFRVLGSRNLASSSAWLSNIGGAGPAAADLASLLDLGSCTISRSSGTTISAGLEISDGLSEGALL